MLATVKTQTGLCTTCVSAETCTFPRPSDRPVVFCEEFDGNLRNGHIENPDVATLLAHVETKSRARSKTLKGLCSNCELHASCTFPKVEGGIWHCEEYR